MQKTISIKTIILILLLTVSQNSVSQEKEVVVAIIDTGVDVNHPLIREHLWTNPHSNQNKIENDGKEIAGDLHGWNFVSNNHDLTDNHGHGTHVAGIILQKANSKKIKFMILKYYDPFRPAVDNLSNTVRAIRYATKMKANIINYSGGGDTRSPQEEEAIREAQRSGILFVAAAGNEGRNTDRLGYYPAGYQLSNIISVAAVDSQQRLLNSSNYGSQSVDIAAPGKDVFSSLPGGRYGFMTGTSQATAWISGLVASIMLHTERLWTPEEIKNFLTKIAIKDQLLAKKIRSKARISSLVAMPQYQ